MNAYARLLHALGGDRPENHLLINDFAHQLADLGAQMYLLGHGEMAVRILDPYQNTRERWDEICGYNGAPETDGLHKPPELKHD